MYYNTVTEKGGLNMRHIPNILTCLRIVMVFVFIALFVKQLYLACLIVFIAAFITDVLDGFLARKFNWVSDFGKLVDPFADKFMLISVLICLLFVEHPPLYPYMLGVVLFKELMMIFGGLFLLKKRKITVYADIWGKLATGMFFICVTLTLVKLTPQFNLIIPDALLTALYAIALIISISSLFHYAYKGGFIGKKYKNKNAYDKDA